MKYKDKAACSCGYGSRFAKQLFLEGFMKLVTDMTIMDMAGEMVGVAVGANSWRFRGMLKLNEEAAEIIRLLKEEITMEDLGKALQEKYADSSSEEISSFLAEFLDQLRNEGLLAD